MGTWIGAVKEMGKALLDFAYPPCCIVCEASVESAELLCEGCWTEIRQDQCPSTQDPVWGEGASAFEKIVVWAPFKGVLQEAIYALKFRNQLRLGRELGRRMGFCLAGTLAPVDYLVPVPLHPARLRERGYNQSAEIAAGLGEALDVPVGHRVMRRCKNTRQQALLSVGERRANLNGAFALDGVWPAGVRIGLVDDVLTTGATLESCAKVLDAASLWAIVLARPDEVAEGPIP